MMPLTIHTLLQLSQDVLESPTGHLPWPEGSILSGKLETASDAQQSVLQIGNYRLLAHIPPNIQKKTVWLQLIDSKLPARFRLLSNTQAKSAIMNMLQEHVEKSDSKQNVSQTTHSDQPTSFNQIDTPYRFVPVSISPLRWIITDKQDEQNPRGMLKTEVTHQGFQLRGRLDLQNLGPVSFIVSNISRGIKLSLFATDTNGYQALKNNFPSWLSGQKTVTSLEGNLNQGAIDDGASDARLA